MCSLRHRRTWFHTQNRFNGGPRNVSIADVVAVLGIGVACLPIALLLLPDLEQSRGQARIAQAYTDVLRLHERMTPPERETELDEKDPWGQPYRLVPLENQRFRVVSSGPNGSSSSTNELQGDDISSDLTTSPIALMLAKQRVQLVAALGVAAAAWILFAVLCMRWRRKWL
jgi:hypothetical protein